MNLSTLKYSKGSVSHKKRIGRGQGSGKGGTSTRGHKGQKSRSGYSKKIGFEGGQMPIQRRLPKFGFKNVNHIKYKVINLNVIQQIADKNKLTDIGIKELLNSNFISQKQNKRVKVLAKGGITSPLKISANAFSKAAEKAVLKVGGSVTKLQ